MKRRVYLWLAVASLLAAAGAATRPRYGGTLRIETRATLASYDPALPPTFDGGDLLRDRVAALVFDRLVGIDALGRPEPALATSWQSDPDLRRWTFDLRPNVKMHDESLLSARVVVASLTAANPSWRVSAQGGAGNESVVIFTPEPQSTLIAQLATARNSIVERAADGTLVGSGPFRVQDWQPGRRATLAANPEYWGGQPFLKSVEITMNRPLAEQALDYRMERVDVVEISPELSRRAAQGGERVDVSSPTDVLGILFPASDSAEQQHLRQAVSLALDRTSIQTVILQRQGEAAGGLLPQWMSGYAFLFPVRAAIDRARLERNDAGKAASVVLAFDGSDPLQRAIADRVAVNARDAGVTVQTFAESAINHAPASAARIALLHLPSASAAVSLSWAASALGRTETSAATSPEALYEQERTLVGAARFVPIVAVGEAYAVAPNIRNWQMRRDGSWNLADVSLQEAP